MPPNSMPPNSMPPDSMPADSRIALDDVPAFAADATARIDETLSRLAETDRDAFWASVRKCYNTPYNDPEPRALPRVADLVAGPSGSPQVAGKSQGGTFAQNPASSQGFGAAVLAAAIAAIPVPGGFGAEAQSA